MSKSLLSNYKNDAIFGDLAEQNFINFYTKLNEKNLININKIGYTETIQETIDKVFEDNKLVFINKKEAENDMLNKLVDNINKLIEVNKKCVFFDRYNLIIDDLIKNKFNGLFNKDLNFNNKIKKDDLNLNFRTQKLGIDLIIVKNNIDYPKLITFLELKSFKAVENMYEKLGIEFFSKFCENEKIAGYSFTMISDILVYAQDVNNNINNDNKKEIRNQIDNKRLNNIEDLDTLTYINVFNNFKFLEKTIDLCNDLKENFYYHTRKTNNYVSCYTNFSYKSYKDALIKQYIYKNNEITKL